MGVLLRTFGSERAKKINLRDLSLYPSQQSLIFKTAPTSPIASIQASHWKKLKDSVTPIFFTQVNPSELLADKGLDKQKIEQDQASGAEEHSPGLFCIPKSPVPIEAETRIYKIPCPIFMNLPGKNLV